MNVLRACTLLSPTCLTTMPPLAPDLSGSAADLSQLSRVEQLLRAMDDAASSIGRGSEAARSSESDKQQRLAEARLGMASALFTALRCKHAATASHSLRVALGCSAWASALQMPEKLRTQLEIAALLHDVGKIGVPDSILLKPGRLSPTQRQAIDASRLSGRQMLQAAGAPAGVIEAVAASASWFDGSRLSEVYDGDTVPLIARIIAIVDAFDSMTTDQVWRPAHSRERALAILFEGAGTRFDPDLVSSYSELFGLDQAQLQADVAQRWIFSLGSGATMPWTPSASSSSGEVNAAVPIQDAFANRLIDNICDAVAFVDRQRVIQRWSIGAERMTGLSASAVLGKTLTPELVGLANGQGEEIVEADCPLSHAMETGVQWLERVSIRSRGGDRLPVNYQVIPVCKSDFDRESIGASVLIRDMSEEQSLEERCQALTAKATRDPLTQVANRAEFDRMLAAFVEAHLQTGLPCSLIMADIDKFKSINDTYGHQAGDAAICSFADLMKSLCRTGDLVARYGGEEFAVICADCNNTTAANRAEIIRQQLANTAQSSLEGKKFTASFGVTELQPGDTPETMLRRSDRALLMAKDQGRNQVVQLGDGMGTIDRPGPGLAGFSKWILGPGKPRGKGAVVRTVLETAVPLAITVEKLRGFVADRDAEILKTDANYLRMAVTQGPAGRGRREGDEEVHFHVDLWLSEERAERANTSGFAAGSYVSTQLELSIEPKKDRERRKPQVVERARELQSSLQAYLMAREKEIADGKPAHA